MTSVEASGVAEVLQLLPDIASRVLAAETELGENSINIITPTILYLSSLDVAEHPQYFVQGTWYDRITEMTDKHVRYRAQSRDI